MMKESHFQQFSSPWKYFLHIDVFATLIVGSIKGGNKYEHRDFQTLFQWLQHLVRTCCYYIIIYDYCLNWPSVIANLNQFNLQPYFQTVKTSF